MKVAVLMATTADAGWETSLKSLRAQSFQPLTFLVVVDRETSAEERQALTAGNPDVTFLFNEVNIGLTRSLNVGLAATDADVIFRIDDDDECDRERIAKQLACLEKTGADLVCSYAHGQVAGETAQWLITCPVGDQELKQALLSRNVIVHSTLGFRREAVQRIGGYDETFRYAQDYDLYLRAMRNGLSFACVPEPLVTRHYLASSITIAKRKTQIMNSFAARILHSAANQDVGDGLKVIQRYAVLLATPNWVRSLRRTISGLSGSGA